MLSGIYYIHEGALRARSPHPTHKDQATNTRTSPPFPAPTQAQHGTPKGCTEATRPKSKD